LYNSDVGVGRRCRRCRRRRWKRREKREIEKYIDVRGRGENDYG
jgi:hypothetical protein